MGCFTSKEKCESIAKKHNIKFEHLIGRTEFYVGTMARHEFLVDLRPLFEESNITFVLRNKIVVVVDYTSNLVLETNTN